MSCSRVTFNAGGASEAFVLLPPRASTLAMCVSFEIEKARTRPLPFGRLALDPAQQPQDQNDEQYEPKTSAGNVTPIAAVRPRGNRAEDQQNQNNQQNGPQHFDCSLDG